jgi:hypothetical protein
VRNDPPRTPARPGAVPCPLRVDVPGTLGDGVNYPVRDNGRRAGEQRRPLRGFAPPERSDTLSMTVGRCRRAPEGGGGASKHSTAGAAHLLPTDSPFGGSGRYQAVPERRESQHALWNQTCGARSVSVSFRTNSTSVRGPSPRSSAHPSQYAERVVAACLRTYTSYVIGVAGIGPRTRTTPGAVAGGRRSAPCHQAVPIGTR